MIKDIMDMHMHSLASGHAYSTITEMLQAAADKGLQIAALTEHGPAMPGGAHPFYFANIKVIDRELLSNRYGFEVLFGVEANIMNASGEIDMNEELCAHTDVVVASMHVPCIKPGSEKENTAAAIGALNHPLVDILGHPDDFRYPLDYERLVEAAKNAHKLIEVNNSSLGPQSFRMGAKENYQRMLEFCKEYEQPIIVNSDAHFESAVGQHELALALLNEVDFPDELIVNRSPEAVKPYLLRYRRHDR